MHELLVRHAQREEQRLQAVYTANVRRGRHQAVQPQGAAPSPALAVMIGLADRDGGSDPSAVGPEHVELRAGDVLAHDYLRACRLILRPITPSRSAPKVRDSSASW